MTQAGKLEPVARSYIPQSMDEQLIRLWGTVMSDVASTYLHNLTRSPGTPARFERAAVNERIPKSELPEFRKFLEQEGQAFLERVDAWLSERELKEGAPEPTGGTIRLGLGLYHVQD